MFSAKKDCSIQEKYLWKQYMDPSDFLHGHNYQGKIGSETFDLGWVWPVVRLVKFLEKIKVS